MAQKGQKRQKDQGIAYQNKDIISKIFAERMPDKSFKVYGVDMPKIVCALPTNLPAVEANKWRMDNLYLLEDDSVAIVDYESAYLKKNKLKYLGYIQRVLKRYFKENDKFVRLRLIIIYTGDVKPDQTESVLDAGCLTLKIEEAFLSEIDSKETAERISRKIKDEEALTEQELMKFIILPLTYSGTEQKEKAIRHAVDLAECVKDEEIQTFLLTGLLVFTDKIIDKETAERIRRNISMTKVGRIFYEEMMQAVENAEKKTTQETAKRMIQKGKMTLEEIAEYLPDLSFNELKKIQKEILQEELIPTER